MAAIPEIPFLSIDQDRRSANIWLGCRLGIHGLNLISPPFAIDKKHGSRLANLPLLQRQPPQDHPLHQSREASPGQPTE